jgi:signal transduction histidine kinase
MTVRTPRRRGWIAWVVYVVAALLVLEGLAWASYRLIELERAQRIAEAEAQAEQRLRLALWRMDSYVFPILAREAARPYFHYLPGYAANAPYDLAWDVGDAGARTPSPLSGLNALDPTDPFRLHAQLDRDGTMVVPSAGHAGTRANPSGTPEQARAQRDADRLAAIARDEARAIWAAVDASLAQPDRTTGAPGARAERPPFDALDDGSSRDAATEQRLAERYTRQRAADRAFNQTEAFADAPAGDAATHVRVGPFQPRWLGADDSAELVLVRGVVYGGAPRAQLLWVDWPRLRGSLLAEAGGLVSQLELVASPGGGGGISPDELATIPVRAHSRAPVASRPGVSPATAAALWATWIGAVAALGGIGIVLWVSRRVAEQRWRFVTAVSHELRTPLTGLRLHAELLGAGRPATADDADAQRVAAVQDDAKRLGDVVESVLAFAQLSTPAGDPARGGSVGPAIDSALRAVEPAVERAGAVVSVELEPGVAQAQVRLDEASLTRIVVNLLENAIRHGRPERAAGGAGAGGAPVRILGSVDDAGRVRVVVADDGPGLSWGDRRRVFRAFARRAEPGGTGVGLGLALARGLAKAGGGRLRAVEPPAPSTGAAFELVLPTRAGEGD